MKTFVCILKTGGDYTPAHVQILQNQVMRSLPSTERFLCLTDYGTIKGVETKELVLDLRGKYSMMEAFRIKGPVMVTGLDTIMVGDLDGFWNLITSSLPNDFWMIKAFNPGRDYANGVMGWNGDWSNLITEFKVDDCYKFALEQAYTIKKLKVLFANIRTVNDHFTIRSYKHDYMDTNREPSKKEFLLFHGSPRPHEVGDAWIKELYQ